MIIKMRPYTGEADKRVMVALVRAHADEYIHVTDLPYRLSSWALDDPARVGLWEDGAGQLLGWAVLQSPFWMLDYAYTPAAREYGLGPAILTWAEARARTVAAQPGGHPFWFAATREDQTDRLGDLAHAGFVPQPGWGQVWFARPAADPIPAAALPDGFTIRPLAGGAEAEAYAALHRAAFDSPNMTGPWRARTLATPEYVPALDLVVEAPGGRLAAFCVGWLDPVRSLGQVEPLGVHPEFQGAGLGRAVLFEVLRRLRDHGARTLTVETDIFRDAARGLYEAAGFRQAYPIVVCRQDVGPAGQEEEQA